MTEKEALTRVKTGNFNSGYGFDMQLLVDAVGTIGEMFNSGQISEVVRCKDCEFKDGACCDYSAVYVHDNGYCNWGRRRE